MTVGLIEEPTPVLPEGKKLTQYLGSLAASLCSVVIGMALAWTSSADTVQSKSALGFGVSEEEWSWVGAVITLGAIIGAPPTGFLVTSLGRRVTILLLVPLMMAGWAMHFWANAVWMLVMGRILLGMAIGTACIAVPIYTCEIAETSIRGAVGSYFELLMCVGGTITYALGVFVSLDNMNVICLVSPVVFGAVYMWFPDTPHWLISRGRIDDARKSLLFYRGANYDVDAELQDLEQAHTESVQEKGSFYEVFETRAARKGLLIAVGVQMFGQVTGINSITFYASNIFKDAGSSLDIYQASVLVGCSQILGTYSGTLLVDRLGRRTLLLLSAGVMGICTALLGTYLFFAKYLCVDMKHLGWSPVAAVVAYVFAFEFGYGPIPWLLCGEMFPERIKGVASGIANSSNWGCVFLVTKFYFTVSKAVGVYTTFWFFSAMCVLSCIFVRTLLVETKGKTLEQIQDELAGRKLRVHRRSIISVVT